MIVGKICIAWYKEGPSSRALLYWCSSQTADYLYATLTTRYNNANELTDLDAMIVLICGLCNLTGCLIVK
jgi:hypothetical protein